MRRRGKSAILTARGELAVSTRAARNLMEEGATAETRVCVWSLDNRVLGPVV